jgi:hypothetical protein
MVGVFCYYDPNGTLEGNEFSWAQINVLHNDAQLNSDDTGCELSTF